jgi:tripartite-type tricarboxylate transporter receptor subunit TctC
MHTLKRVVIAACFAAMGMLSWPQAFAQAWPHRQPIKLVAVFPPGGSVDQVARILAVPWLRNWAPLSSWRTRAAPRGRSAPPPWPPRRPDGYTFAVVFDTFGVNPALIPGLPYDSRKDLDPIVLVGTSPMVLATYAGSEYKTFADVVGAAKAKKNVSYGSIGSGSLGHLAMALLGKNGQMDWHPRALQGRRAADDRMRWPGMCRLSIGSVFVTKPHLDSKRMRALSVTTSKRSPRNCRTCRRLPKAASQASTHPRGGPMLAPARTPPDILQAHERGSQQGDEGARRWRRKLDAQGIDVVGGTPESARVFIERQMDIWAKVVKDNGIKAD